MEKSQRYNVLIYSLLILTFSINPCHSVFAIHDSTGLVSKSFTGLSSIDKVKLLSDSAAKYSDSDFSKSIHFGELAVSYFDDKTPDSLKIKVYTHMFRSSHMLGIYDKALLYVYEELKIREKDYSLNEGNIAACFVNIGETYRAANDYDNSIKFLTNAIDIYLKLNSDSGNKGLVSAYERMAAVYFELAVNKKDDAFFNLAREYAFKSIELADKYNLIQRKISNWNILGACEMYKRNFAKALEYLEMALKASQLESDYSNRINIEANIGGCYLELKEYAKAIDICENAFEEAKKREITVYIKMTSKILYDSYSNLDNYEKAFSYLMEYTRANDILRNEERDRTISMIEQKSLNELRHNEMNKEKERYIILTAAGVLVTVLILIGFLMRNRVLNRINKQLIDNGDLISKQKSKLEEVNESQNMFFSILSHDLRNPFNGILGFLNILKNDFDTLTNDEKKQYIDYVNISANQVFKLIERLLELARLKDGRYQFKFENVNIREITGQVLQLQRTNTLNKKVTLENNISKDVLIYADKVSVDTILRNLTDNAIKFTPAGGKVSLESEFKDSKVVVYVKDNGVGMDSEDMENIFRLDRRITSKGTNDEKGTGLGLYVCKEMIEKMNGSIKVESVIGKGSTFIVTFPEKV
ncbi:MAG: tetratricopeptide repeat-containing sensor histidine kinase [Candidatus Kapaibacterium sp.]